MMPMADISFPILEGRGRKVGRRPAMRHEIFPSRSNWRFHSVAISSMIEYLRIADQMTQEFASTNPDHAAGDSMSDRLRVSDYLWRPWYAKVWWAAIPIYWLPAGGPTWISALAGFYESGWALLPNILFIPITAFLVLGFGYFRRLFADAELFDDMDEEELLDGRRPGRPSPTMDMFNPRSGPLWIGNRPIN